MVVEKEEEEEKEEKEEEHLVNIRRETIDKIIELLNMVDDTLPHRLHFYALGLAHLRLSERERNKKPACLL